MTFHEPTPTEPPTEPNPGVPLTPPPGWAPPAPPPEAGWPPPPADGWGAPPPAPRRAHAPIAIVIAVALALVLVSGGAGAGLVLALRARNSDSSSASRFVVPGSPFDGGQGTFGDGSGGSGTSPDQGGASTGSLDPDTIASRVDAAVVNIQTTMSSGDEAAGTGMVLTSSGEVLTNNHVIDGATSIQAEIGTTGKTYRAHVVGYDVSDDVAVLQLEHASGLKAVSIGSSSGVSVNDSIVAIGNALGRGGTPTAVGGVVTALDQAITASDGTSAGERLTGMIRISASIQPGDSGGPLVDGGARVVGMTTAADTGGGSFGQTTGDTAFAVPIDKAMSIVHVVEAGRSTSRVHVGDRALLGVDLRAGDASLGDGTDTTAGALVAGVQSDSGADHAGLQAGDVIVSLDGRTIGSADALRAALETSNPGDTVKVGWVDADGAHHTANVRLGSGPPA